MTTGKQLKLMFIAPLAWLEAKQGKAFHGSHQTGPIISPQGLSFLANYLNTLQENDHPYQKVNPFLNRLLVSPWSREMEYI